VEAGLLVVGTSGEEGAAVVVLPVVAEQWRVAWGQEACSGVALVLALAALEAALVWPAVLVMVAAAWEPAVGVAKLFSLVAVGP
jgi:hypothetical protein